MQFVVLELDDTLFEFYRKVGQTAGGLTPEQVMSDALFQLAGHLASQLGSSEAQQTS